jgi:drug/metabolite transporter (DMT)-like permease
MEDPSLHHHGRFRVFAGILLVAIGTLLLLDHLGYLTVEPLRRYWPFLITLVGVGAILRASHARRMLGGLWLAFLGLWLFVSHEHVWGLWPGNSWPILIIFTGAIVMAKGILGRNDDHKTRRCRIGAKEDLS